MKIPSTLYKQIRQIETSNLTNTQFAMTVWAEIQKMAQANENIVQQNRNLMSQVEDLKNDFDYVIQTIDDNMKEQIQEALKQKDVTLSSVDSSVRSNASDSSDSSETNVTQAAHTPSVDSSVSSVSKSSDLSELSTHDVSGNGNDDHNSMSDSDSESSESGILGEQSSSDITDIDVTTSDEDVNPMAVVQNPGSIAIAASDAWKTEKSKTMGELKDSIHTIYNPPRPPHPGGGIRRRRRPAVPAQRTWLPGTSVQLPYRSE